MNPTRYATTEVAEQMLLRDTRDQWSLGDAVLRDIPHQGHGGDRRSADQPTANGGSVAQELDRIVAQLAQYGITRTDGTPYSVVYLRNLRDTAILWPPEDRQAEASFETHRENGGQTRQVFLALCAHARGEAVAMPDGTDPEAWRDALDKVATAKRLWKVQAQAVRTALRKAPKNTPTRLDGATFGELLQFITRGGEGLAAFRSRVGQYELTADDKRRFAGAARLLAREATDVAELLEVDLSDEALRVFTEGGRQ